MALSDLLNATIRTAIALGVRRCTARNSALSSDNAALKAAADGAMKGVLDYTADPLVSSDFNHHPASSTVDSLETSVMEGKLARVVSWYDNEWGFSNRMIDTAGVMATFL